jgi:Family of unknown function (DUF6526)
MAEPQNFKNHSKFVPGFHYFVLPILLINLGWTVHNAWQVLNPNTEMQVLLAAALFVGFGLTRSFALRVQDRVIRLEMHLRLERLLSADMRVRIPEFTLGQLVSLRFASDAELPALARKVLDEKLENRAAIKKLVTNWQADNLRA